MEIKGYTAEEAAKEKKKKLMMDYKLIENKLAEACKLENEITKIRIEYRIESVNRVLNYIRSKKITDSKRLDTLLCHCQNKLNGNIDGIELELNESEK